MRKVNGGGRELDSRGDRKLVVSALSVQSNHSGLACTLCLAKPNLVLSQSITKSNSTKLTEDGRSASPEDTVMSSGLLAVCFQSSPSYEEARTQLCSLARKLPGHYSIFPGLQSSRDLEPVSWAAAEGLMSSQEEESLPSFLLPGYMSQCLYWPEPSSHLAGSLAASPFGKVSEKNPGVGTLVLSTVVR